MEKSNLSFLRLIQIEYLSFLAAMFLVLSWPITLIWGIQPLTLDDFYLAIAFTILSPLVLVWRYARLNHLYTLGIETEATVNSVGFFRGRGKIKYIYSYAGQKYISAMTVNKSRRTDKYRVGDKVSVLIDSNSPKQSVITDLYK